VSLPRVNLGFLGCGTVGCGAVRVLQENRELLQQRTGIDFCVRKIAVRDPDRRRDLDLDPDLLTTSTTAVVDDPEIQLVVEVIGGVTVAREAVRRALSQGKSVVTCNKELLARHWNELHEIAATTGAELFFEGSVAGGIPLLGAMRGGLVGNRFSKVMGIVNGTTNYILTEMTEKRRPFTEVLKEAQANGYAEADPSADVDGWDSLYKLVILTALAYGQQVDLEAVARQGIRHVTPRDIAYAENLNYVIKLLATVQRVEGALQLEVHPCLVPKTHPLAGVTGIYNAVLVEGDAVGRVMFYGRGAGGGPTGSAVVADVCEAGRNLVADGRKRTPPRRREDIRVRPTGDIRSKFCLRMNVADRPGVLAQIAGVFGDNQVSLASVVQLESTGEQAEIVCVTHEVCQYQMDAALTRMRSLACVSEICSVLHVEEE